MTRADVFQVLEDTGCGYEYSGIPADKLTVRVDDLKAMLEYIESCTEATCDFDNAVKFGVYSNDVTPEELEMLFSDEGSNE